MPIEIVALTFVVVAFTAIGARFMARDADGRAQLPAIVDRSVGAYLFRRLTGRPTSTRRRHTQRPRISIDGRADVPSGPPLIQPTRLVVASARRPPEPARPVGTAHRVVPAGIGGPPRKRPSALVLQRQAAATLAVSVLVLMVIGVVLAPHGLEGGVLGATGTPGSTEPTATPLRASEAPPVPTVSPNAPAASG